MSSMEYQRPEFKHYPLKAEELRQLHQDTYALDKQIRDNNLELKALNNKIARTDYEQQLYQRLKAKQQVLNEKHRQLNEIMQTQMQIEDELKKKKLKDNELRNNLANQYKSTIEERRRKQEEDKRREIEAERNMQLYNRQLVEEELRRKKQVNQSVKRSAQEQIILREQLKQQQKQQLEREKHLYNQRANALSYLQSHKQASYKQYYQQFMDHQNKLHSLYEHKAGPQDMANDQARNNFIYRGVQQGRLRQAKQYQQYVQKQAKTRQQLRNSLQRQIQEKEMKRLQQKAQQARTHQIARYYEHENKQLQLMELQRKKEEQKRYGEGLNTQLKIRQSMQQYSPHSSRGYSLHNPITNPIDFKIGITNPYVIQNYEDTKNKYMGEQGLRLRNLAMIGNKSLGKWKESP